MSKTSLMKKIVQIIKSFTLWELLIGMKLTGRYLFAKKVTLQFPEEKHLILPAFVDYTHYVVILMVKKDVLHVSYVKRFALLWL